MENGLIHCRIQPVQILFLFPQKKSLKTQDYFVLIGTFSEIFINFVIADRTEAPVRD